MVLGVSVDTLDDEQKFTDKEKLTFPILADADKTAAAAYGVLSDKGYANRTTFVIDKKGVVRKVYPSVSSAGDHPDEVLQYVKKNLTGKE